MVVEHVFPADAEYVFEIALNSGNNARFEDIDISINGERVALLEYEPGAAGGADGRGGRSIRTEADPRSRGPTASWPRRSCVRSTGRTKISSGRTTGRSPAAGPAAPASPRCRTSGT